LLEYVPACEMKRSNASILDKYHGEADTCSRFLRVFKDLYTAERVGCQTNYPMPTQKKVSRNAWPHKVGRGFVPAISRTLPVLFSADTCSGTWSVASALKSVNANVRRSANNFDLRLFVMHWLPGSRKSPNLVQGYTIKSIIIGNTGRAFDMYRGCNDPRYLRLQDLLITYRCAITELYHNDFVPA
jgi:hypothetical protein